VIVSRVLAFLSLQIPFYILGNMGVRLVSALKRNVLLTIIAGVNMVLNVVLNWIFMKYAGVAGIALSTAIVSMVSCLMVFGSIFTSLKGLGRGRISHGNFGL
jgi:putative peptidoglycan lipid II flippase